MIQSTVAISTIEVEYMAAVEVAKKALWLTWLVRELGIQQSGVLLYCDSENAIYLAKNQVYHVRTKHIDVRFHKIRELIAIGELLLEKIYTSENAMDMLTNYYCRQIQVLLRFDKCFQVLERRGEEVAAPNLLVPGGGLILDYL